MDVKIRRYYKQLFTTSVYMPSFVNAYQIAFLVIIIVSFEILPQNKNIFF